MITTGKSESVPPRTYNDGETVRSVEKRVLIGPKQGAENFVMRRFTIGVGGHTPYHTHPWEHEVYVLRGSGEACFSGGKEAIGPDDYVFVPSLDEHQFVNTGDEPLEFLCLVPLEGDDG